MKTSIAALKFPILAFVRDMVFPVRSQEEATQCTKYALNSGYFSGQILVDSDGVAIEVKEARKLHGIGALWGYDIFLNQRIKVEIELEAHSEQLLSLHAIKGRVLKALRGPQEWNASADVDNLIASVERAETISEVTNIVTEAYYSSDPVK